MTAEEIAALITENAAMRATLANAQATLADPRVCRTAERIAEYEDDFVNHVGKLSASERAAIIDRLRILLTGEQRSLRVDPDAPLWGYEIIGQRLSDGVIYVRPTSSAARVLARLTTPTTEVPNGR